MKITFEMEFIKYENGKYESMPDWMKDKIKDNQVFTGKWETIYDGEYVGWCNKRQNLFICDAVDMNKFFELFE